MVPPQWEHWSLVATAVALPAAIGVWWAVVGWVAVQRWWIRLPAAALAVGVVWAGVEYMDWPGDAVPSLAQLGGWLAHAGEAWWREYREIWPHPTDDLVLYVPSLAFWVGLATLAVSRRLD